VDSWHLLHSVRAFGGVFVVFFVLVLTLSLLIAMPDLERNWSLGCRVNIFFYISELAMNFRNFIKKQASDEVFQVLSSF